MKLYTHAKLSIPNNLKRKPKNAEANLAIEHMKQLNEWMDSRLG